MSFSVMDQKSFTKMSLVFRENANHGFLGGRDGSQQTYQVDFFKDGNFTDLNFQQ